MPISGFPLTHQDKYHTKWCIIVIHSVYLLSLPLYICSTIMISKYIKQEIECCWRWLLLIYIVPESLCVYLSISTRQNTHEEWKWSSFVSIVEKSLRLIINGFIYGLETTVQKFIWSDKCVEMVFFLLLRFCFSCLVSRKIVRRWSGVLFVYS